MPARGWAGFTGRIPLIMAGSIGSRRAGDEIQLILSQLMLRRARRIFHSRGTFDGGGAADAHQRVSTPFNAKNTIRMPDILGWDFIHLWKRRADESVG